MTLGEKIQHLRAVEGQQRGLGRPLTKMELVRAMERELGESLSHAYLSQLESGVRQHLTQRSRQLLARFFKVHPGYLVSDPEGFQTHLDAEVVQLEAGLSGSLRGLAEELVSREPAAAHTLLKLARCEQPEAYLRVLDRLLDLKPERVEGLLS